MSPLPPAANTTATPTSTASPGITSDAASRTNLNTAGMSATAAPGAGGNATSDRTSAPPPRKTFNPLDPPGAVVMVLPATTATPTPLYKIGDYVTWVWNYTGLSATPTAVDVLVACSTAQETWTLTQNMTFRSPATYTWDTGAFQSSNVASPLLTDMYHIIVYDAESSQSAAPEAGYLAAYAGFQFGMYTGQPYTPLSEWTCATCSAAVSDAERRAMAMAAVMSVVTVLSFTWFVTGFAGAL